VRRLAASNIAWLPEEEAEAFAVLRSHGVTGVEVAPTVLWPDWEGATPAAAAAYRRRLEDDGLACPALQAVLYGVDAALFGTAAERQRLSDHLRRVAGLAHALGAGVVVLGAPGHRRRGSLRREEAFATAVEIFAALAADYEAAGVTLCLEPNPSEYGCDFVTSAAEGAELVDAVASPGFGLHLDAGALILGEEPLAHAPRHFHASEPHLGAFESPSPQHADFAAALNGCWVSLELRRAGLAELDRALAFVAETYA
jgi:D-psicose/D-tagatose/L-ribulose 3-epimerase